MSFKTALLTLITLIAWYYLALLILFAVKNKSLTDAFFKSELSLKDFVARTEDYRKLQINRRRIYIVFTLFVLFELVHSCLP